MVNGFPLINIFFKSVFDYGVLAGEYSQETEATRNEQEEFDIKV